jgi:Family of unknown function (DUF5343)
MVDKTEKSKLPAYMPFGTFINFINDLRKTSLPSKIDRSLMPNASGSLVSSLIGSLKFLALIADDGRPTQKMQKLVEASDEDRKPLFKDLLEDSYPFLRMTSDFDLQKATTAEVADQFRAQEISGSTVSKGIAFLIALAKAADFKLSPHLKPLAPPRSGKKNGKANGKRDVEAVQSSGPSDANDSEDRGVPDGMPGFVKIPIPLHGMEDGAVFLPDNMTKAQWTYALKITKFLIENYRQDDAPEGDEVNR